jgi:hypothetical protein
MTEFDEIGKEKADESKTPWSKTVDTAKPELDAIPEPPPQSVTVTFTPTGELNINVQGTDGIHAIVMLQTAIGMISQRLQKQARADIQISSPIRRK